MLIYGDHHPAVCSHKFVAIVDFKSAFSDKAMQLHF